MNAKVVNLKVVMATDLVSDEDLMNLSSKSSFPSWGDAEYTLVDSEIFEDCCETEGIKMKMEIPKDITFVALEG